VSIEQVQHLEFGKSGQSDKYVGLGWSLAEPTHRWMIGAFSQLTVGPVVAGASHILILDLEPLLSPPTLTSQNLSLSIDGVPFAQTELTNGGRYGYRLPPELITSDGDLTISFDHPNAARPSDISAQKDYRTLAISVSNLELWHVEGEVDTALIAGQGGLSITELEQRVGMPADEFVARFESLGDNCEFGLIQRRCGSEPLSLLRFTNTLLPTLIRGLQNGFQGMGEPKDLSFRLEDKVKPEYIIQEHRYGLVYHTFRYKGEIDEKKFIVSESARIKFLLRKFTEDLQAGEKIFVCKRNVPISEEEILPLLTALNAYADNALLWVVPADGKHPPGWAGWVMPGLIKGYIDRFAPNENAHDLSLNPWLEVCANAYELRQRAKTGR
jgi:hypothetical protein